MKMVEQKPEFDVDDAVVLLLGADPGPREKAGGIQGITRLEKLVFLLDKETDARSVMTEDPDFEAHNFGPFSQKIYRAIDMLAAAGIVRDSSALSSTNDDQEEAASVIGRDAASAPYSSRDLHLTPTGREYYEALLAELPPQFVAQANELRRRFAGWSLRELLRYVYKNYESYTDNSIIKDEILGGR